MKKYVSTVVFFLFLVSCINIDDDTNSHPINGTWKLKNVSGGLRGVDLDYNDEEVTWFFNEKNKELKAKNTIINTGPQSVYLPLANGDYLYEIKLKEGSENLYINDVKKGSITISKDTLFIDEGVASDGMLYKFIR